jgi:hypothetical protein
MRIKWFLIGAATASAVWALAITQIGNQWIKSLFGGG